MKHLGRISFGFLFTMTAFAVEPSGVVCVPDCRKGFVCHQGQCISACNPPCGEREVCSENAECLPFTAPAKEPVKTPEVSTPTAAKSVSSGSFGIRAGVGTDITLGLAYGGSINYLIPVGYQYLEAGPLVYFSHSEESSEEYGHTYDETTDLAVFGVMGNFLFGYPGNGPFFIFGIGFAAMAVEYEERSPTDASLGTPLPGGGSMQTEDGTTGGSVINIGMGFKLGRAADLRLEFPVIVIPGDLGAVVPTATATLGFRF